MPPGGSLQFDPIDEARRQWTTHGWGAEAPAMAALTSVMRVQQIFLARVERVLRPMGLTFARYETLRLLAFSRTGSLPLGKVGERLQVHPGSVTNAIDRLEQQGLVRRRPHPTDGRTTLAEITPSGRRLTERATVALNAEVFAELGLSNRELTDLIDILRKVRYGSGDFA
jgi:DNA-binding MarR family transcriptional regulator